jgi:GNAT superfamily N-acetyltransferase
VHDSSELAVRVASSDGDRRAVAHTICLAFHDDPTWSWVFPDAALRQEQYAALFGVFVASAMRYPWVLMTPRSEAAAIWIPPDGTELTEEEEAYLAPLLDELLGSRATEALELFDLFDAAHPHHEPHYYLGFLGTHPVHAGRGIGMRLLGESLTRIDREHRPAYLESSNPLNNHRYERHGFAKVGEFRPPGRETPVTTMWRDAR